MPDAPNDLRSDTDATDATDATGDDAATGGGTDGAAPKGGKSSKARKAARREAAKRATRREAEAPAPGDDVAPGEADDTSSDPEESWAAPDPVDVPEPVRAAGPAGPEDHDGDEHDDEASAPVIACLRCDARVPRGSRYCPQCGVPLVRSGLDAATALSRTRRRTHWPSRVVAPVVVVVVLVAVLGVAGVLPGSSDDGVRSDLEDGLGRVVRADRQLTASLSALGPNASPSRAGAAARAAIATTTAELDALAELDTTDETAAAIQRVNTSMTAARAYFTTVQRVVRDPGGGALRTLGTRSQAAIDALRSTDDIVASGGATGGAARLAANARARLERARRD